MEKEDEFDAKGEDGLPVDSFEEIATGGGESSQTPPLALTRIRHAILPYLPPPVVQGIRYSDRYLLEQSLIGDEPSMVILGSIMVAYLLIKLVRNITYTGKAIVDDDETALAKEMQQESFQHTVLFVGPSQAGKTRLFYHSCHNKSKDIQTVISLRPNIGFSNKLRFMDYPGNWDMSQLPTNKVRVVLVLDATKSAAPAATILHQLLRHFSSTRPPVFVACHQTDRRGAKNPKRLRLQLRSELERVFQVSTDDDSLIAGYQPGQSFVLEQLITELAFVATSLETDIGLKELEKFVQEGILPEVKPTRR
mmetsp:Transcript_10918/g.16098  ORF Transcript_10918/g.16098 Transcript_10918/m.16098 type:complete len:308 (-) Transcript_10918:51-974(-)|eukprot:CAMPEP_0194220484 /NCGR_PEP_ID=MMETSP0156-20130528/28485_1 /TAXON_ID=33649 /ORGANISM="Thalassionema nitzschioides, Strain L26-B" /LENGTH=307 /DNA_ID=CAMNT_0038950541 /DNA_START=38 /DNA_END=961 /DNA_ORIENTATION=+